MTEKERVHETEPAIQFAEFLESIPPGTLMDISDLTKARHYANGSLAGYEIFTPEIRLHCPNDACNGIRFFRRTNRDVPDIPDNTYHYFYLNYRCSNCRDTEKDFSLAAQRDKGSASGSCYKFGELPEYGPPTPSRLITLIGPDRELFLKGRRCENQGLGIGAFVYYRRVVESQKDRILAEVIKVLKRIGAPETMIKQLESAKAEAQFSKALSNVKDALPESLLINGHNPLTLLHSALSDGLHQKTDESCLEIATSVRVVLAELSERLAQALKDEAELNKALAKLMPQKEDKA